MTAALSTPTLVSGITGPIAGARRVLVVGLHAREYGTIASLLRRTWFEVDRVIHGPGAAELLARIAFDLILLRLPLQDIGVADLLRQVRAAGSPNRQASLLLLAPASEEKTARTLLGRGANRLLRLDGGRAGLEAVVSQLLNIAPRKATRLPTRLQVKLHGTDTVAIAMTRNVSATGMLVESDLEVERGAQIQFEFMLAHRPVKGVALIVRLARPEHESMSGFGLRFLTFEGDSRSRYQDYLDRL